MKKSRYVFGIIILVFGALGFLSSIFTGPITVIMMSISLMLISTLILPILDSIFAKKDIYFSTGRKVVMGLVTFFIGPFFFPTESKWWHLLIYVAVLSLFWFIMIITNKKKYSEVYKFKSETKQEQKTEKTEKSENLINDDSIYQDLNIITLSVISKSLSETREKREHSVFCDDMPEIDINKVVIRFIEDVKGFDKISELDSFFTFDYYYKIRDEYFKELEKYIKNKITANHPRLNIKQRADYYYKTAGILIDTIPSISSAKILNAISSTQSLDTDLYSQIDDQYNDAFAYMIDAMASATTIAKILFIEQKVKNIDQTGEFYKIIKNMAKEIKNPEKIIEKTRPVYDEFYRYEMGGIEDEIQYNFAIVNMVNRIQVPKLSKKTVEALEITENKYNDIEALKSEVIKWINNVSKKTNKDDIYIYTLLKIYNSIDSNNFELLLTALSDVKIYDFIYKKRLEYNIKESDKERYLKGDFSKEMKELSGKYTLNNIVTGPQFEMYLENLFNELGYKVKRSGKAGDQGADLILKKGDYVYAIQAKFYTGKLSNTPVQEVAGALKLYNANQGVVITNSEFTSGAKQLAKANDVILIDGKGLKKLTDYAMNNETSKDVLKDFE